MMKENLSYLFESYFHQDWRSEYDSSFDLIKGFLLIESKDSVEKLIIGFEALSVREDISSDLLNSMGANFNPESEGFLIDDWINKVLLILNETKEG